MSYEDQHTFYTSVQNDHPDVSYYKRDDISLVLSKGLALTVHVSPRNPIEYFSNWLLEYSKVQKKAKEEKLRDEKVAKMVEEHLEVLQEENARKEAAAKTA